MKEKYNKHLPKIKKDLKDFLTSEEGKIVEKNAVKLAISLIAVAGVLSGVMKPEDVQGACTHTSHGSHGSHGSRGSHCSGGWCD